MKILVLLFVLITGQAHAERITPYAGEHENFTRVVIPSLAQAAVDIDQGERQIRIALPETASIDLQRLFRRISKQRLLDASAQSGSLIIQLGCACVVLTHRNPEIGLILDIAGDQVTQSGHPRPRARPQRATAQAETTQPNPSELPQTTASHFAAPSPHGERALDQFRDALRAQLLELPQSDTSPPAATVPQVTAPEPQPTSIGIETHHAMSPEPLPAHSPDPNSCGDPDTIDPRAWGLGSSLPVFLSHLPKPSPENATEARDFEIAQAKAYLGFGLAEEARWLLRAHADHDLNAERLLLLAQIVIAPAPSKPLLEQMCPDAVTKFWQALSASEPVGLAHNDAQSVVLVFQSLTPELQSRLQPRLGDFLTRNGEVGLAQIVEQVPPKTETSQHSEYNIEDPLNMLTASLDGPKTLDETMATATEATLYEHRADADYAGLSQQAMELFLESNKLVHAKELAATSADPQLISQYYEHLIDAADDGHFLTEAFDPMADQLNHDLSARMKVRLSELGVVDSPPGSLRTTQPVHGPPAQSARPIQPELPSLTNARAALASALELRKDIKGVLGDEIRAER